MHGKHTRMQPGCRRLKNTLLGIEDYLNDLISMLMMKRTIFILAVLAITLISGCSQKTVKTGDKIKVDYVGTFDDGTVFDSSEKHGQPLEFQAGMGQMIPGFDNAVIVMKIGEEKDIRLQPSEAYGEHNPQLVQKLSREQMPAEEEPEVGMMLAISTPDGNQLTAKITEVTDDEVTIDLNPPMAGKALNFKIKVVEISS